MKVEGRQLTIVSSAAVIERAERFGVRIAVEIAPSLEFGCLVAHAFASHVLLPGQRADLGVLIVEDESDAARFVCGTSAGEVERDVRAVLRPVLQRVSIVQSDRPASAYGGTVAAEVEACAQLH